MAHIARTLTRKNRRVIGKTDHFMNICRANESKHPQLKRISAIALSESFVLPVRSENFKGLVIELRKAQGGRRSDAKIQALQEFADQGWATAVCTTWRDAWIAVQSHLKNKNQIKDIGNDAKSI